MTVRVEHTAESNVYELGDDIEGVFVPFVTLPGDSVKGRIASVQAIEQANQAAGGGASSARTSGRADDFNAADFTDNGDGTYTRKSDGVTGRFSPSGFEQVTTP